jgi:hypothetical protein
MDSFFNRTNKRKSKAMPDVKHKKARLMIQAG